MTAAAQVSVYVPYPAQPDAWTPLPRKGTSNAAGEIHFILALDNTV